MASTGLFTDVSQRTDVNLKNTMGKLAYYLKGLEQVPNFRRLKIKVTSEHGSSTGICTSCLYLTAKLPET